MTPTEFIEIEARIHSNPIVVIISHNLFKFLLPVSRIVHIKVQIYICIELIAFTKEEGKKVEIGEERWRRKQE